MLKQCRLEKSCVDKYHVYLYHDGKLISSEEHLTGKEFDMYLENLEKDGYKQCYSSKEIQESKRIYDNRSEYAIGGAPHWIDSDCFDAHYQPIYQCSECGKQVADNYISYHKYCLHCGVKMHEVVK